MMNAMETTTDKALKALSRAIESEDRYLMSSNITPLGRMKMKAKVQSCLDECKRLGVNVIHPS